MSFGPIRKPKPRRALRDERRSPRGLVVGGFASIVATTVLAAGSVAADSPAQAAVIDHASPHSQALGVVGAQPEPALEGRHGAKDALKHTAGDALTPAIDGFLASEADNPLAQVVDEALQRKQEEEAANRAEAPVAPGEYHLGAGWGAVGAWSRYHTGVDLTAPVGTPVHAAAAGVVAPSDAGGWAGVHAVIRHSDGSSLYAHLSSLTVRPGDQVSAGQLIGYVGITGRSFGAHLHFEFYPNDASTSDPYSTKDPSAWLESRGVRL